MAAGLRAQVPARIKAVVHEQVIADLGGEVDRVAQLGSGLGQAARQQLDVGHQDRAVGLVEQGTGFADLPSNSLFLSGEPASGKRKQRATTGAYC